MKTNATLSPKFQIAIPKAVRDRLRLKPGQKFVVIPKGDGVLILPEPEVDDLVGLTRGADTGDYRDRRDRF
jgi:AbrB family looped-hinge helix DNA binding protein